MRGEREIGCLGSRISSMKLLSGPSSSSRFFVTISRPRCQVVSTTNTRPAITSGNQPPCRIFGRLAVKNVRSTSRKRPPHAIATHSGFFHSTYTTTENSTVSIASVPVTAMP